MNSLLMTGDHSGERGGPYFVCTPSIRPAFTGPRRRPLPWLAMRVSSLLAGPLAGVALVAASASPASATIAYAPCAPTGFECGTLSVPLDRTGATPGAVALSVKRVVSSANPTRTAVVALAGGPGQAAIPVAPFFAQTLGPALATRDLLVSDQRGTGASGRLRCATLEQGSGSLLRAISGCAGQLGPARAFFRSTDSVDDLEALRVESGYERLVLFGVSYGTKVAADYAARYPDRVESMVLDSVVLPEGSDVFNRSSLVAVGRVLREVCAGGQCRGISANPLGDVRALVLRSQRRPLRGTINTPGGRQVRIELDDAGLMEILLAGDLNPTLRAELPGAMRSALRSDLRPLLRIAARAAGLDGVPSRRLQDPSAGGDSDALFVATRCEESVFPWDRAAGAEARADAALAAGRAIPRAQLGAFNYRVGLQSEVIPLCLGWPNASPPPAAPGPLPAVPTLILSGAGDVRTPLEDAQALAARIPGAQLLAIPHTGHSVLGSDQSACSGAAVAAFFSGAPVAACAPTRNPFEPTPVAPTRLSRVPGSSLSRRTLNAVGQTVVDVANQFLGAAIAVGREPRPGERVAGLRSGSARLRSTGIRLERVEYVPGVTVSGLLATGDEAASTFTVGGSAAARGRIRISASGRITGTLGGRRVNRAPGAARAARVQGSDWASRLPPLSPAARRG